MDTSNQEEVAAVSDVSDTSGSAEPTATVEPAEEVAAASPAPAKAKPKKSAWPALILVMAAIAGLVGWRVFTIMQNGDQVPEQAEDGEALAVKVVVAKTGSIQGWVTSDGQVQATRGKHLLFETSGEVKYLAKIDGRDLREGDVVRAGQLLARIDDRTYLSDIRATDADVKVAQQSKSQAEAELEIAKANLAAAESDLELAKSEHRRREELYEAGALAASEVDIYRNRVDQAEASKRVRQQSIRSAEDNVRTTEASLVSAKARLENARIAQEDTQLVSPIDGVVSFLNIREGDYWTPQRVQVSGDYQSIVETVPIIVIDPTELDVIVELPAFQGARLRPGQRAYIVPDEKMSQASVSGLTDRTLVNLATAGGQLFAVNPAVTPGGRATEVRVRITQGIRNLRVGAKVSVWIEAETNRNATVLPFGAFIFRDREAYVFVVNPATDKVEQRKVSQGIEGLKLIEVRDGVAPGELVVTEGRNRLVDGATVQTIDE